MHRRAIPLDGHLYTVLSPRPSPTYKFATHRLHDTWQVVTDAAGARLLGRLFWAMAFQKRDRTIVVIDPGLMLPDPLDAQPSSPITILNSDLGPFSREAAGDLLCNLPFTTASAGTVVLQTRGLDAALAGHVAVEREATSPRLHDQQPPSRIDTAGGLVALTAPPTVLRAWGVLSSRLGQPSDDGSDEASLDWLDSTVAIRVLEDFEGGGD